MVPFFVNDRGSLLHRKSAGHTLHIERSVAYASKRTRQRGSPTVAVYAPGVPRTEIEAEVLEKSGCPEPLSK